MILEGVFSVFEVKKHDFGGHPGRKTRFWRSKTRLWRSKNTILGVIRVENHENPGSGVIFFVKIGGFFRNRSLFSSFSRGPDVFLIKNRGFRSKRAPQNQVNVHVSQVFCTSKRAPLLITAAIGAAVPQRAPFGAQTKPS